MKKKVKILLILLIAGAAVALIAARLLSKAVPEEAVKIISPFRGTIETSISTTGTVLPENRLEIKPPVNGRIDRIMVKEGQFVKAGQLLARMSSTERAALLDAAQGQDKKQFEYWEQVYKPIALLSPIDGQVIVATMQPGQTVTTADPVIVLSDHLIVRAQADETDIGKVKLGQRALVSLDAYPEESVGAVVGHIYYESRTVNNVTIYDVDLVPEEVPLFFRSGMNVNIDFIVESKKGALLVPVEAVFRDKAEAYVFVESGEKQPRRQEVELGMTDDKNIEVVSGLTPEDKIVVKTTKFALPQTSQGANPFFPSRRR